MIPGLVYITLLNLLNFETDVAILLTLNKSLKIPFFLNISYLENELTRMSICKSILL